MQLIVDTYYRPNADFSQHESSQAGRSDFSVRGCYPSDCGAGCSTHVNQSGGFRMVDSPCLDRDQECLKG